MKSEDDRAAEAVGGELEPALGDVGQIVEATGVEHRCASGGRSAPEIRSISASRATARRTGRDDEQDRAPRRAPTVGGGGGGPEGQD